MSIVRIGLAETKQFSEGYAAIFGGKKNSGNSGETVGLKIKKPRKTKPRKRKKPKK